MSKLPKFPRMALSDAHYCRRIKIWSEEFVAQLEELSNEAEKYPLNDAYMMGRRDLLRFVLEAFKE